MIGALLHSQYRNQRRVRRDYGGTSTAMTDETRRASDPPGESSVASRLSPTPVGAIAPERALSSRYELMGKLSTGGMATLHIARLVGLAEFEKVVVLKRVLPAFAGDADYVHMFEDEARVAATLEHPHIVHTHDIGQDTDGPFFTMEYLHGENVKRILSATALAGERLPFELALQIAIGCAAGLHHAHEHRDYTGRPLGIVHRDVSPSNIIVTYQSGVKLIDFGIAKAASGKHVTGVGVVKGKASYMSPEQCRGEALDRRSDVFSLGVVLYEMTAMQRPFTAPDEFVVLAKILRDDPPPPSKLRPDYPAALERVVLRALAKDPADRYPSAFELQEELELVTRECKLHALPGALGRYLEHLFGPKPYPWAQFYRQPPPPPQPSRSALLEAATKPRRRADPPNAARAFDPNEMTTEPSRIASESTHGADPDAPSPTATVESMHFSQRTVNEAAPPREPDPVPSRSSTRTVVTAVAVSCVVGLLAWIAMTPQDEVPSSVSAAPQPQVAEPGIAASTLPPITPAPPVAVPEPAAVPIPTVNEGAASEPETNAAAIDEPPPPPAAAAPLDRAARKREAMRLVAEGRRVLFSDADAARALAIARKSIALHPTQDGYALLGLAGCRNTDARAAGIAYSHLRGKRRDDLARTCATKGIRLE